MPHKHFYELEDYHYWLKRDCSLILSVINWLDDANESTDIESKHEAIEHALHLLEHWKKSTYDCILPELEHSYSEALKEIKSST